MPKNLIVEDIIPKNAAVEDVIAKNVQVDPQSVTRSYQVAHTAGVIMLSVPLITYASAGTETQWSESGGVF